MREDYWDGGGAVLLTGGAVATCSLCRFEDCRVDVYPDGRRRALTCGGGAVSVVDGSSMEFEYTLFDGNSAPRGGAVCAHASEVRFRSAVFRGNEASYGWFGRTPAGDVECVTDCPGGSSWQALGEDCTYLADEAATALEWERDWKGGTSGTLVAACRGPDDPKFVRLKQALTGALAGVLSA